MERSQTERATPSAAKRRKNAAHSVSRGYGSKNREAPAEAKEQPWRRGTQLYKFQNETVDPP